MTISAIGQDSHAFDFTDKNKKLILAGIEFSGYPPLIGNSDADVVFHAVTNAISGITGINVIGIISDKMCKKGITNSKEYLKRAMEYLFDYEIVHLSISIEAKIPSISPKIVKMKQSLGDILQLSPMKIGITATTGEGLTDCGKGMGIQVLAIITAEKRKK